MFYAIFTASNEVCSPSLQYSAQGQLTEDEADELRRQLIGSSANVIQFDDADQFYAYIQELDDEFFEQQVEQFEKDIDPLYI